MLVAVVQARAVLEAAESQRRQTLWLVIATWALVLVTFALVIVALFVRPEIIVEVPHPE